MSHNHVSSNNCQKSYINNVKVEEQEINLSNISFNECSDFSNLSEKQSTSYISNKSFKINKDSFTIENREHLISPFFVGDSFVLSNVVLPGEFFEKSDFGEFRQCQIYLSKYRFVIVSDLLIYSTPIINLESVESKEVTGLQIWCKDGRTIRVTAESREIALFWFKKLTQCACAQRNHNDLFTTHFHLSVIRNTKLPTWIRKEAFSFVSPTHSHELIERELHRFGLEEKFRISCVNDEFRLCETYPQYLIVPYNLKDEELMNLRFCRSACRIPAIVWGNKNTGSVLLRSSQPIQGLFGTNQSDLDLMNKIRSALKEQNKFCFFDLRSYAAAWGNCAKGGGFENGEAYDGVIEFLGLANIHNVRSYFHQLRTLLNAPCDPNSFYQNLQGTTWLQSIWHLLQATSRCIKALCFENYSVLVHCTDGWDRTSQVVSLCMLIADPFYRTFEGFEILIQRQWIEFGHKFADRTSALNGSPDERSPIFLQFLDCVYQLWCLNSHLFEFNRRYLLKLVQHTYSGLFSSFIFNNLKEASLSGYVRIDEPRKFMSSKLTNIFTENNKLIIPKSFSVFDYLGKHNAEFLNPTYDQTSTKILNLPKSMYDIELWRDAYCSIKSLNSINNPDDKFNSTELTIKSNLNTVNDSELSTQLLQPHDKVISRSQSANSLKLLEQQGTNIYNNNTANLNTNAITYGNNSQPNLHIFTKEEIDEYLDVDGLSKIPNIYEERVVALYRELQSLKLKQNSLQNNLFNQYPIINNFKDSQKLNLASTSCSTNTVNTNDYNNYYNIPNSCNNLNLNSNNNNSTTNNLYQQQNISKRERNESLDSSNYEMLLEELDGLTLNGLFTKRKKDSVGSSGSGSNLDNSICSNNQSFSNKNRLLQQSIVNELQENDLPSSSTEDLVIGTDNYNNNNYKNKSNGSEKLNDSFINNGGSTIRCSVSPAQIPNFINNVEDISSVPSSFSSAITEIHFQNGNEIDNVDDDLRKDQLVAG